MKTNTSRGGYWEYEVIDGTRRHPKGFIGTYPRRAEALEARQRLCRLGGFVRRIHKGVPKPSTDSWWEIGRWNSDAQYGWGTRAEAYAYIDRLNAKLDSNDPHPYSADRIDDEAVQERLNDHPEYGFNLADELSEQAHEEAKVVKPRTPCYVTNGTDYLVQLPADNPWGFSLSDDDQTWPGGFGSGWSTWEIVPTTKVPKRVREELGWIIDEWDAAGRDITR